MYSSTLKIPIQIVNHKLCATTKPSKQFTPSTVEFN